MLPRRGRGLYTYQVFFQNAMNCKKMQTEGINGMFHGKISVFLDTNYLYVLTFCYFVFDDSRMKRSQVVTKLPLLPFYVIVAGR